MICVSEKLICVSIPIPLCSTVLACPPPPLLSVWGTLTKKKKALVLPDCCCFQTPAFLLLQVPAAVLLRNLVNKLKTAKLPVSGCCCRVLKPLVSYLAMAKNAPPPHVHDHLVGPHTDFQWTSIKCKIEIHSRLLLFYLPYLSWNNQGRPLIWP